MLDKVDTGRITPTAGAELSFLDTKHQAILNDYIEKEDLGVSIQQAKNVRKLHIDGTLNEKNLDSTFVEDKFEKFYSDLKRLKSYFSDGYTTRQCEDALWEMLGKYIKQ